MHDHSPVQPVNIHASTSPAPRPEVRWWRIGLLDHAFGNGSTGWLRSRCGRERWTVNAQPWTFAEPSAPCPDCLLSLERDRPIDAAAELGLGHPR